MVVSGAGAAADAELLDMRAKARAIESKAKARSDEAQRLISAQRAQIEKLKEENRQLHQELSMDSRGGLSASISQQDRLDKLHELNDTYTRKIEMESRQVESIQQELELTQVKVHELRKGMGGAHAPDESQRQAAKHRLVLENRLEQAERRFCETLAKNREMREEIESLNKQREVLQQAQAKLERELAAKRSEVASLRQVANVAAEARSVAASQLESLKTQSDKEQALFDAETAALARVLSGDQQLLEAQAQRLERLLEAPEVEGGAVQEEPGGPTFQEAVEKLAKAANIEASKLSELVSHYSSLEAANFATFNECNAANEQIAAMQKKIRATENEARQAEVEGVLGKQKEVIRQTLTKRDQALRRAEVLDEKRLAMERRLTSITAGVSQVLKALGCPPPALVSRQLDSSPGGALAGPGPSASALQRQLSQTQRQAAGLATALGALEARSRAVVAVWSVVMGKTASVPGAKAMVASSASSALSRDAAAAAKAGGAKAASASASSRGTVAEGQAGKKTSYGNATFDDSESDSDGDEAPLTRDQIQERLLAGSR